ncbi:MAG: type II toxin-antitoxin system ParD family antitoxin [Hydrogenophaga sp.]|nr:type II toxin-antitoxin system ParD family antitoxin [Hydrogenophaga sp.]
MGNSDRSKAVVDEQETTPGSGAASEHLAGCEVARWQMRSVLLAGKSSPATQALDGSYFKSLRKRVLGVDPAALV